MKKSGPSKAPTALKLLKGTFRPDPKFTNEPEPEPVMPEIPAHLSDEARAEWSRVAQELFILGILSQVDRVAFAAYCEAWADWVDACKKCAIEGFTIVQPSTGNIVMNPHFNAKTRAAELMHKFLTEFGMTPASRTRINAPPKKKKKDDKWEGVG